MPTDNNLAKTSIVFEAGENLEFLAAKLQQTLVSGRSSPAKVWVACQPGQKHKILGRFPALLPKFDAVEVHSFNRDLLPLIATPFFGYLPAAAPYSPPPLEGLTEGVPLLRPWVPPVSLKENEWARLVYMSFGWVCARDLLRPYQELEISPSLRDLERIGRETGNPLPYFSIPAGRDSGGRESVRSGPVKLIENSKILAVVPHFKCEPWLEQCLYSLANQTRPPDAIAVLDDASPHPPLDIVRKFKGVTLLRSPQNVGPYRLIQSAIDQTKFDGYLFQDADDWSSLDRLELQLNEAEKTGADWIGCQELIYFEDVIHAVCYPLVLNQTPDVRLRNFFSHPTGLVTRDLVNRLGGFASGLHFSGDFEFLSRVVWEGKAVNLDRYAYFRRIRKDSLITAEDTGLASPARREVDAQIQKRIKENLDRAGKGQPPLLDPLVKGEPVVWEHLTGPKFN